MTSTQQQPALATTKRKFNRLLDNLTASTSTTSLASSLQESNASTASLSEPDSPDQPSKRPRSAGVSSERQRNISEGQERIRQLKEQLLTPRREGTVRVVGKTAYTPKASTPKASTPRKEPNFQPYSQEHFLARLKTFADVKKWTTKPDAINEVQWAMRGWSCDIWNTVACKGGCENRVAVKLRPKRKDAKGRDLEMSEDLAVDIDDALVKRYKELIVEGHAEDCLWRKRGCQGMCFGVYEAKAISNNPNRRYLPYSYRIADKELSRITRSISLAEGHSYRPTFPRAHRLPRSVDTPHHRAHTLHIFHLHTRYTISYFVNRRCSLRLCAFRLDWCVRIAHLARSMQPLLPTARPLALFRLTPPRNEQKTRRASGKPPPQPCRIPSRTLSLEKRRRAGKLQRRSHSQHGRLANAPIHASGQAQRRCFIIYFLCSCSTFATQADAEETARQPHGQRRSRCRARVSARQHG